MEITRVGADLAKNIFQVHGVNVGERPVWRKSLNRSIWLSELQRHVPVGAEIGLEACSGAHHWGRELTALGYQLKLMAPQFVKPYVKSNKSDRNDAAAICEAMSRPSMRFVALKTTEQQDIQAVHRVRSEVVKQRTAKANQIRGLVGEYGLVAPKSIHALRASIPCWLKDADVGLSDRFRRLLARLAEDLRYLDARVDEYNDEIAVMAKELPTAKRLMTLQGVGPIIATALASTLGAGDGFSKGRDFAVSLGLTPKHSGTGGRERILGISRLRRSLIDGKQVEPARVKPESPLGR